MSLSGGHRLHEGIDQPGNSGARAENEDGAQSQQNDHQGDEPPFLFLSGELEEFFD